MSEISKERKQFWANETQTTLRELIFNQSQPSLSYDEVRTKFLRGIKKQEIPYFLGQKSGYESSKNALKDHNRSEFPFFFAVMLPFSLLSTLAWVEELPFIWLAITLAIISVIAGFIIRRKVHTGTEAFNIDFDEAYTSLKQELDSINQTNPSPNFSIE